MSPSDKAVASAVLASTAQNFVDEVLRNPRTRRAAEELATALLLASSAECTEPKEPTVLHFPGGTVRL